MSSQLIPVILCGGSGTRLWPLSRSMRPKQFIELVGKQSLFQKTVERVRTIPGMKSPVVLCNEDHRFMVAEQLQEMGINDSTIILEPSGRNTAPAIASAAIKLNTDHHQDDCTLLVLPADHLIENPQQFQKSVETAVSAAQNGSMVTFGVLPDHPSTGYGYLKVGELDQGEAIQRVERFVEKPELKTAQDYVAQGNYYWNSGMFVFKASTFIKELKKHQPDIFDCVAKAIDKASEDLDFLRLDSDGYSACENISVDYAIMEKSDNVAMVSLGSRWSDVGSWSALWENGEKDVGGNVSKGDVWLENVKNSYIHAENKLVSVIGLDDVIVVETHDGVMVSHKSSDQDVKTIVSRLGDAGRPETELHRKAFRPWGNYDCLDSGDRFQVKRIEVKPGQCTSLQRHSQRAEHWVVVSGTAEVTRDDEVFNLKENESAFIPLGSVHRLKNPGTDTLEIIEVQSGSYLGEDDIERMDDEYGRE